MAPQLRVWPIALCWSVIAALPLPAAEAADDGKLLQAAGVATDGRRLLDFFHRQTATEITRQRAQRLIRQLGSDAFPVREKASSDLVALLGPVVLPLLRQAMVRGGGPGNPRMPSFCGTNPDRLYARCRRGRRPSGGRAKAARRRRDASCLPARSL